MAANDSDLTNLPKEIVEHVFDYLTDQDKLIALEACTATCNIVKGIFNAKRQATYRFLLYAPFLSFQVPAVDEGQAWKKAPETITSLEAQDGPKIGETDAYLVEALAWMTHFLVHLRYMTRFDPDVTPIKGLMSDMSTEAKKITRVVRVMHDKPTFMTRNYYVQGEGIKRARTSAGECNTMMKHVAEGINKIRELLYETHKLVVPGPFDQAVYTAHLNDFKSFVQKRDANFKFVDARTTEPR